jgi:Flp pilus assembly protein TadG
MFKITKYLDPRRPLGDSGVSGIELGLLAPFMVLMMTGGFDFGHALYEQHRLAGAVRAGLQYAIQNSTTWNDSSDIIAAVRSDANDTSNSLTVTTSECTCPSGTTTCSASSVCTGSAVAGTYVKVTVSETYNTLVSYPFVTTPFPLSSQGFMRVH